MSLGEAPGKLGKTWSLSGDIEITVDYSWNL